MNRHTALLVLALPVWGLGCTETPTAFPLRSLERSGEVSFVCVDEEGTGHDIDACPDFDNETNRRHMLALVTQTLRGEVAVVDLSAGRVLDLDYSTPGFSFLPVGANPTDIVSTPGGVASFVGVAEVGMEGIFSLPSSCARSAHDIVSWSACALPSAPGEMAILIDPPVGDADPSTPDPVRATCDSQPSLEAATPGTALAATRADCAADLALETTPPGRRKLLVLLPDLGGFAVIDAQNVLDREPGSYKPCEIERFIALEVELPTADVPQKVPEDLQAPGCVLPELNYGPIPNTFLPQPSGFDLADGRLLIADRGAPVVHALDISDPCAPTQQPPLLPHSFEAPGRVVTTRQVAISPPTSTGQRFAYAIDDWDGSVMAFEVTPGHSDRTPIVRPGAPRMPFEPPDRIAFGSPARDLVFALRDAPIADPETGVATFGTACDPDPGVDPDSPAAKYRPNSDYTRGASPRNLRGVFGFTMLANGQVAVIDVEDFDAPCRRPVPANSAAIEDFRGCAGDPANLSYFTLDGLVDGKRTVSGELSCRMVEPHRARSGRMLINNSDFGVNGPALRGLPRLRAPEGASLPNDQTDEGKQNPKLLAVGYENPKGGVTPAQVHVGMSLFRAPSADDPNPANPLPVDPSVADRSSVTLVLAEPRAFTADEDMTLQYEGSITGERPAGFPALTPAGEADELRDADGYFCARGVQDVAVARTVGEELGVPAAKLDAFARRHADYLQVTQALRDKDGSYWTDSIGASCGGTSGKSAYFLCRDTFGTDDAPGELRDFRIVEAYQDRLVIEPMSYADEQDRDRIIELLYCCFGGGAAIEYDVRAGSQWVLTGSQSGFRHDVIANDDLRCERDCNPRRQHLKSRAFEVSSSGCVVPEEGPGTCAIGPATPEDVACVVGDQNPLIPGGAGAACIFQNLTHRFAVYRGNQPTPRGTAFTWQVTGGFVALSANLAAQSRAVSPQSIVLVPQINQLAVADGASEGLVLISLDSVSVSRLFF